jgi:hypothetical protein
MPVRIVTQLSTRRRQTDNEKRRSGSNGTHNATKGSSGRRSPVIRISVYSQRVQDRYPRDRSAIVQGRSSRALTAIGIFLFFGAVMASLVGTTLLWRHSPRSHVGA